MAGCRAIQGLPGSGKTCYAVYLMMLVLADWARQIHKSGKPYGRVMYTNIPLHMEAVNDYLSSECGFEVDMTDYVVILDDDFFVTENGDPREWWEDFPEFAYLVIDEFQKYLSSSSRYKKGGVNFTDKFMKYIAMHRHRGHDILLLSQSVKNISCDARRQVEVMYTVLNIKQMNFGIFPFTVPMADIDQVRQSWGMEAQFARIQRHILEGEKFVPQKGVEIYVLRPKIFRLYQSETMLSEHQEKPVLDMSRTESILWLCRRHLFRWCIWGTIAFVVLQGGCTMVRTVPKALSGMNLTGKKDPKPEKEETTSTVVHDHKEPETTQENDKIIGFVRGGVITPRGVLRKDDHIYIDGEKDFVGNVDMRLGILYLGSGKKVQK